MTRTRAAALIVVILTLLAAAYLLGPTVVGILATVAALAVCVALGYTVAQEKAVPEQP